MKSIAKYFSTLTICLGMFMVIASNFFTNPVMADEPVAECTQDDCKVNRNNKCYVSNTIGCPDTECLCATLTAPNCDCQVKPTPEPPGGI